jgi:ABC-type Fe3+/spermidine/putrescine transport system ATPase subunit
MTLEYQNYGNTDNSNLKRAIFLLLGVVFFIAILTGVVIATKGNPQPTVVEKKEEPISNLVKELAIMEKTIGKEDVLSVNSNNEYLTIKIRQNTPEKKYLPLLIRYENYVNIHYNIDKTVELKIKKEVFAK